jgi:uncharacterized protein (TIGR03435 family)
MTHRIRMVGMAAGLVTAALRAQSQPAAPQLKFEVASIKPAPDMMTVLSAGGKPHLGMKVDGAMVDIGGWSLKMLILTAYKLKPYQVSGPDWMDSVRFDILAKIPEGGTKDQVPEMLQALLAERFKLTAHRETKEQPVYGLVVGKDGPKLKPSVPDVDAPPDLATKDAADDGRGGSIKTTRRNGDNISGVIPNGPNGRTNIAVANGMLHMEWAKMTLIALAEGLVPYLNRPVVDMTGLKGTYQVTMEFSLADTMGVVRAADQRNGVAPAGGDAPAMASDPTGSSVFSSVQRLGLKLESRKAPVEQLMVDHLEKTPTEN